jgi:hypothetical protein
MRPVALHLNSKYATSERPRAVTGLTTFYHTIHEIRKALEGSRDAQGPLAQRVID